MQSFNRNIPEEHTSIEFQCESFTDRSEWVHLPDDDYTFTIRGDIAKELIIANCRWAEKELERMKENDE